jgi:hypothetical protein
MKVFGISISKKMTVTVLSMVLMPTLSVYFPAEVASQIINVVGGIVATYLAGQSYVDGQSG